MRFIKKVGEISYYTAEIADTESIVQIDTQSFPENLRAPRNFFIGVMKAFPDGTFLAMQGETPVGYFCNMLVNDNYVERLEEFLRSSPVLPVPDGGGKNLLHESIGITQRGHNIAKELILCTGGIIRKYKVKRLVAILETEAGNRLTKKLGFQVIKRVQTPVGEATIRARSARGFIKRVREAL